MKTVDQIMEAINSPEAPKYINLTRFWYWRESASMIRWADNYDNMTWEVERMILQLENDMREDVKKFIAERKDRKQVIKKQIIEQYIAELQEKTL